MNDYLQAMEARMSEDQKNMLKRIYEPTVVATPLNDAGLDTCILPDGEIRSYGYLDGRYRGDVAIYLSSVDGGVSWTKHFAKGTMNACTYIPERKIYIKQDFIEEEDLFGTFAYISTIGPDDTNPRLVKISDEIYQHCSLPQKSEFTDRIWFMAERRTPPPELYAFPVFIYSDDFGETWTAYEMEKTERPDRFYPNKGEIWRSGTEPYAIELSKNKMMALIRTPMDFQYQAFSYDGGTTWTEQEPSVFHGSNTNPHMLKLSDGRSIVFWNNTQGLPELRHEKQMPPLPEVYSDGTGEDVFTNRDVNHAAITDDAGETWIGFREVLRSAVRNNADFRQISDIPLKTDKGVHQYQAYELPFGKVLLHTGQSIPARKLVIFDANWLYEKEAKEHFELGLRNVSTQVYLKSISGSYAGLNGHCAWNRTNGAVMMPNPDGGYSESVLISKHHDERLFNDIQGVVWNFPASKTGTVMAEIKLMEKRVRFSLSDRWFNPCDEYCGELSQFSFELDTDDLDPVFTKVYIS